MIDLQVTFTVAELAGMANVSRKVMRRMLARNRIRTIPPRPKRGQRVRVSFAALMDAFPEFLRSIDLLQEVSR